jgi:hypothetical protein
MKNLLFSSIFMLLSIPLFAEEPDTTQTVEFDQIAAMVAYQTYIDSIANTLIYRTDTVTIGDNLATLNVPQGYRYINGEVRQSH